jgi:hypothetical protein
MKIKYSKKKNTKKSTTPQREFFSAEKVDTRITESDGIPGGAYINTGIKKTESFTKWHRGVWLPSDANLPLWLARLKAALYRAYNKWFGKNIVSEQELLIQSQVIDGLQQQLLEEVKKREKLEVNFEEYNALKELAKQIQPSKRKEYEEFLKKFEEKIKASIADDTNIEELKTDLKNNRWIFGLDCEVEAKNKEIDNQARLDMHIITKYGGDRFIEFKSPNKKLLRKKEGEESRLIITPELSEALSEILVYMQKADYYSNTYEEGTLKVRKPAGIIVMDGYLSPAEANFIKDFNFHLRPHIMIVTYDHLITNAKNEIAFIP